jgi:hypothetical protein
MVSNGWCNRYKYIQKMIQSAPIKLNQLTLLSWQFYPDWASEKKIKAVPTIFFRLANIRLEGSKCSRYLEGPDLLRYCLRFENEWKIF